MRAKSFATACMLSPMESGSERLLVEYHIEFIIVHQGHIAISVVRKSTEDH